jgi:hypothetical protein
MALNGNLKDFNIANLIQFNCIEKNTVQIIINWKGYEAVLFIQNGDIFHAKFRNLNGEAALYKILRLDEGEFSITKPRTIPQRTIHDSWKSLLLEGMRVMDESLKEKDTIVQSIALNLSRHPAINRLLIITGQGECIQNSGFDSIEQYGVFASVFLERAKYFSSSLSLGDVTYASYSVCDNNLYFFKCENLYIIAQMNRESNGEPLFALAKELKEKLSSADLTTESNDEIVTEVHIR